MIHPPRKTEHRFQFTSSLGSFSLNRRSISPQRPEGRLSFYAEANSPPDSVPVRLRYFHTSQVSLDSRAVAFTEEVTSEMPKPRGSRQKQIEALAERPVFEEGHTIVRVMRACGENIYEVEDENGTKNLYQLPKRMRHVVFIRRGSYVFVRDDATRGSSRVRGEIEVVVLDQFLHELSAESFWPPAFNTRKDSGAASAAPPNDTDEVGLGDRASSDDAQEDWEIGGGNPNRRKWDHVSSDEDSDG